MLDTGPRGPISLKEFGPSSAGTWRRATPHQCELSQHPARDVGQQKHDQPEQDDPHTEQRRALEPGPTPVNARERDGAVTIGSREKSSHPHPRCSEASYSRKQSERR